MRKPLVFQRATLKNWEWPSRGTRLTYVPRGPQLIFLDVDLSSLSISCGLYVLYKAARAVDGRTIYIGIAHVLLVYVGLAQACPN